MKSELLSIVSPIYNAESFVHRLLDSILEQDYPSIEMIAVDDGSKDNTLAVLESYIPKFAEKGYSLKVLHQENSGQSVAINKALKLVQGEYLAWPDSDDYLVDKSYYSKLIKSLSEAGEEYTMARTLPTFVAEDTQAKRELVWNWEHEDLFDDCLFAGHDYWFQPICYLAKMSAIDKYIPGREIYTSRHSGQNWQLMLPLLYRHKCKTVKTYGAYVLERASSHSRGQYKTYEEKEMRNFGYIDTIFGVLKTMEGDFSDKMRKVRVVFYRYNMMLALHDGRLDGVTKSYKLLKEMGVNKGIDRFRAIFLRLPARKLLLKFRRVRKILWMK